ncbi:unnamed protein product [Rhodiola kirilowii]
MAQKNGQEEAEFKAVPETLNLCINNCSINGNPSTNYMCQKCFNTTTTSDAVAAPCKFTAEKSLRSTSPPASDREDALAETSVGPERSSDGRRKMGMNSTLFVLITILCNNSNFNVVLKQSIFKFWILLC